MLKVNNKSTRTMSNVTRIFAQSRQGRWIFFLGLELEQAVFMLNVYLLEIPQISLFLREKKGFHFSINALRHSFATSFCHSSYFEKKLLFFYLPCQETIEQVTFLFTYCYYPVYLHKKHQYTRIFSRNSFVRNLKIVNK